jgi:hypothetical protein
MHAIQKAAASVASTERAFTKYCSSLPSQQPGRNGVENGPTGFGRRSYDVTIYFKRLSGRTLPTSPEAAEDGEKSRWAGA